MSFEPEGIHPKGAMENLQLLHGTLPHEVVCTENLTPFLKLLPCKGKAGISSLLDGHKLFDAAWQTMAIDIRPVCSPAGDCILEIEHTVDMVLDIARSKRPRGKKLLSLTKKPELTRVDNPIPRPLPIEDMECDTSKPYHGQDTCFPLHKNTEPAWSIAEVFGRPIKGSCRLTDDEETANASLCVNVPAERTVDVRSDEPYEQKAHHDSDVRCFKLPTDGNFDLIFPEQALSQATALEQPRLYASRSITGYGQERGGVQAVIINPSTTESINLVYLESLPWYMKPYLHTLRASLSSSSGETTSNDPIKETYYRPALDRHRGTHLELLLTIPPSSTLTITYDFEKAILRYTEYPPDANRGFDVAPAVIRLLPSAGHSRDIYLRTTSLLLPLPTPDFSMPYNVIILTSTVMALGFGSIFNLLVRRLVAADEVGPAKMALILLQLKGRIRGLIQRIKDRLGKKSVKKE
jgi:phosphatidylinositol glycan class T